MDGEDQRERGGVPGAVWEELFGGLNMKNKWERIVIGLALFGFLVICYGISWLAICGIVKLVTMCFGLTFKWSVATGIWLILCVLKMTFHQSKD